MKKGTRTKRALLLDLPRYQSASDDAAFVNSDCQVCAEARPGKYPTPYGLACTYCYRYVLTPVVCSSCGTRKVRAKHGDNSACCAICRHRTLIATLACTACGDILRKVEEWTERGPICTKCYQRERPARRCGHCWNYYQTVRMNSRYGEGRPICHRCVYKRLPKCSECKLPFRPTPNAAETTICHKCASGERPKVRCVCGAWTRQFYRIPALCINCSLKEKVVPKTRERLMKGLRQTWTKELFSNYCDALISRTRWANRIPMTLREDFEIFAGMDRAFSSKHQVNECSLASALGPLLFRRRTRVLRWMTSHSLIWPLSPLDREWALLPWRLNTLMGKKRPKWIMEIMDALYQDVVREREQFVCKHHKRTRVPLKARSALLNFLAARDFLTTVDTWGISKVTAIQQEHVDRYVASLIRPRQALGRFIRFLNQRTSRFQSLSLPAPRSMSATVKPMTPEEFDDLIVRMMQPQTQIDLKYMLITLLCLFFCQYPKSAVALRQEQFREISGQWEFRPAKVWLSIPDPMATLLARWQEGRREQSIMDATGSSPFLFPGMRASTCVSTCALSSWLTKRGIRLEQLFASGFANLCRHGLVFASVARDAYGVNPATAVRYLSEFQPAKAATAAREIRASMTKRRRKR